jgi:hypothetical protein
MEALNTPEDRNKAAEALVERITLRRGPEPPRDRRHQEIVPVVSWGSKRALRRFGNANSLTNPNLFSPSRGLTPMPLIHIKGGFAPFAFFST